MRFARPRATATVIAAAVNLHRGDRGEDCFPFLLLDEVLAIRVQDNEGDHPPLNHIFSLRPLRTLRLISFPALPGFSNSAPSHLALERLPWQRTCRLWPLETPRTRPFG
jgi:hypothetical protein